MPRSRKSDERRLPDLSAEPALPAHFESQFPPDELDECPPLFTDLAPGERAVQKWTYFEGRVVWFAVTQQTIADGRWVDVARYDSCHSEAHIHRFRQGSATERRKSLSVLSSIGDVEAAFDHAFELLLDGWKKERDRWRR